MCVHRLPLWGLPSMHQPSGQLGQERIESTPWVYKIYALPSALLPLEKRACTVLATFPAPSPLEYKKNTSAVGCGALQTHFVYKHFRKSKVVIRHQDLSICLMEHASLYVCACVMSLSCSFFLLSLSLFLSCSHSHSLCAHAVLYAFSFFHIPVHPLRVKSIEARHARRRT